MIVADGASMSRAKPSNRAAKGRVVTNVDVARGGTTAKASTSPAQQRQQPASRGGSGARQAPTVGAKASTEPAARPSTAVTSTPVTGSAMSQHQYETMNPTPRKSGGKERKAPSGDAAKASDELSYYDEDGTVAEAGNNNYINEINNVMSAALDSGDWFSDVNLDEVEGWDPDAFNYDLVFHGNADVNPFGVVYGYESMVDPETGEAYLVLSDAANDAREEFLYSLYSNPALADAFGDYAGMSREDFSKLYDEANSFVDNLSSISETGYSMFGGDDAALRSAAELALLYDLGIPMTDDKNLLDLYLNEDGTYDQDLVIDNMEAYLANELMRSAAGDLMDENGILSAEGSELAADRLGWRQDDLNNVASAENLHYLAGTNEGANTTAHRGDWTLHEEGSPDEDWLSYASQQGWGNQGRYGGATPLTVENMADNVFAIYTGMGYTG